MPAKKKSQEQENGGSNFIKVEEEQPIEPIDDLSELEAEQESGVSPEVIATSNALIVGVLCDIMNKVVLMITDMEEVTFDEAEIEQLKEVWSPLMPSMSPTALAVVTTAIIVSSKLAIYMSLKNQKKNKLEEYKEEVNSEKPSKVKE